MDPVHVDNEGWWFWDETWADRIGPYTTEEYARYVLKSYCKWLDTGNPYKTVIILTQGGINRIDLPL